MKGQANKERLVLINSFINAVKQVIEKNKQTDGNAARMN